MYVQITKIIPIFKTEKSRDSIGVEVNYNVILKLDAPNRTLITGQTDGHLEVLDIKNDKLTGTAVILNDSDINVDDCTIWNLARYIHENIMKSI